MILGPVAPNPVTGSTSVGDSGYVHPDALFIDSAEVAWLGVGRILFPQPFGEDRVRVVEHRWDGLSVTLPAGERVRRVHDAIGSTAIPVAQWTFETYVRGVSHAFQADSDVAKDR